MDAGRLGYSLFMVLATVAAGFLYRRGSRESELTAAQKLGIAIGAFIGATFAAKLPFLITSDPNAGVLASWLGDGKTVLWGLAGGYLGVEVAKWSLYVRERTGDRFVVPVAAAIAIGRLGCLSYGCCYGVPTDQSWGVRSSMADGAAVLRHPVPLYEFAFHSGFALIAWFGIGKGRMRTHWMLVYLIAYAVFRFISEWWREEAIVLGNLTFYQCSAIVIGIVFALVLRSRLRGNRDDRPE